MLIQIPFLQRFSVYLGHPTYTFSIILFLMILAAGLGSLASERIDVERSRRVLLLPVAVCAAVLVETLLLQPVVERTVGWALPGRTFVVAVFVVPLAFVLGFCFPIGLRLVGRRAPQLTAWMWGVNGACGVMASIVAVMISMWIGIDINLVLAAGLYLLLVVPMKALMLVNSERSARTPNFQLPTPKGHSRCSDGRIRNSQRFSDRRQRDSKHSLEFMAYRRPAGSGSG